MEDESTTVLSGFEPHAVPNIHPMARGSMRASHREYWVSKWGRMVIAPLAARVDSFQQVEWKEKQVSRT